MRMQKEMPAGMSAVAVPKWLLMELESQFTTSWSLRNRSGAVFGREKIETLFDHAVTEPIVSSSRAASTKMSGRSEGKITSELAITT